MEPAKVIRLGTVCYLNARPLVAALEPRSDVELVCDVPARLGTLLDRGQVDAALVPLADLIRNAGRWRVVSDACIASEAETLTVRVFSRRPPNAIRTLAVDADSHTSVLLARLLWRRLFDCDLALDVIDVAATPLESLEAVLLIGDKVVDPRRASFAYEVDLGGAWRQHTGLPFVFAVWAVRSDPAERVGHGGPTLRDSGQPGAAVPHGQSRATGPHRVGQSGAAGSQCSGQSGAAVPHDPSRTRQIDALLREARDAGVARAAEIAEAEAAAHGWSRALAREYLTRRLSYRLDASAVEGAERFARLCSEEGLLDAPAALPWPERITDAASGVDVAAAGPGGTRTP